jgi:hypothetical protein
VKHPELFHSGPLCCLYHRSPTWIIIYNICLLCTSPTAVYYMYNNICLLIVNLTKILWFFNCGLVLIHYNCNCSLVLINLKMATWVAETCLWLLCNKITFLYSSAFVGLFKSCICLTNAWNMEHIRQIWYIFTLRCFVFFLYSGEVAFCNTNSK